MLLNSLHFIHIYIFSVIFSENVKHSQRKNDQMINHYTLNMRHTWLLQTLVMQFNVTKTSFRYNCGNMTKSNPSESGHHIECHIKPLNKPNAHTTIVCVGPYISLDDAQDDMEFIKQRTD